MTTAVMEQPAAVQAESSRSKASDPTVSQIIERARSAPPKVLGIWLVNALTALLLWASFAPLDYGPLAWIAVVPLLLLIRLIKSPRRMYLATYLGGLAYWLTSLQWMRLGHVTMYPAWIAMSIYLAFYLPIFVAVTRLFVHRYRVPLILAAPSVWVALEYLRAHLLTGFAWYLLGHSQHEWTLLVQIADIFGGYGVSFLVMMGAAGLAECVSTEWFCKLKLLPANATGGDSLLRGSSRSQFSSVLVVALLVIGACVYGKIRCSQAQFLAGPRVALIQGNFPTEVKQDDYSAREIYLTHFQLTGLTVPYRPDVVVWPETMLRSPLLIYDSDLSDEELKAMHPNIPPSYWRNPRSDINPILRDHAEQADAAMILGVDTRVARRQQSAHYNSAVFVKPHVGIVDRYDKIHRVPFGEYIPLKESLPFLGKLTPYGDTFGIAPGSAAHVFTLNSWRLLPLICFEDTVPHLVRNMVASTTGDSGQPVDVLVNLTNDGWFHGSSELEQHLITASFRSIETRTPMVRAVNTGISAVIDGNGVIREPLAFIDYDAMRSAGTDQTVTKRTSMRDPKTGKFHKQLNAALVVDVPLDHRSSLYVRWGDWFATVCLTLMLAAIFLAFVQRLMNRLPTAAAAEEECSTKNGS